MLPFVTNHYMQTIKGFTRWWALFFQFEIKKRKLLLHEFPCQWICGQICKCVPRQRGDGLLKNQPREANVGNLPSLFKRRDLNKG